MAFSVSYAHEVRKEQSAELSHINGECLVVLLGVSYAVCCMVPLVCCVSVLSAVHFMLHGAVFHFS